MIWIAQIYLLGRRWFALVLVLLPFAIYFFYSTENTEINIGSLAIPALGMGLILTLHFLAEKTRVYIFNRFAKVPGLLIILGIGLSLSLCLSTIFAYLVVFGALTAILLIPLVFTLSPLLPILTRLSPQKIDHPDSNKISRTSVLLTRATLKKVEGSLHPLVLNNAIESTAKQANEPNLSDLAGVLNNLWGVIDSLPENKLREITGMLTTLELNIKLASSDQLNLLIRDMVSELSKISYKDVLPEAMPHNERPTASPSLLAQFSVKLIYSYRINFGPKSRRICAYHPSCSRYAELSLLRFGIVKGSWIALQRMCRCHSMSPGGYDPVPG